MQNHRGQSLSVGAQQLKSNRGQLHLGYQTLECWLPNFAHCIDRPPGHKFSNETFCSQSMLSVRVGGAQGRPCWASSAQLPNKRVSEHFAQGPICPPDITGLAEEVRLACTPGFRRGGALGGPGQPSMNFTGKLPNLGAHAP
eukprot:1161523-Pelagomonas_calceolata.AAC.3